MKGLAGQVQRKVFRVDNTLDKAQPLRNEISGIVSNKDAANIKLDVVLGLLGFEEVEGRALGNEEDGTEFLLTFVGEVLDSEVVFPVTESWLEGCNVRP